AAPPGPPPSPYTTLFRSRLGGLPRLERYQPGSGVPPKFIGGTPDQVREQLEALAAEYGLEEIMIQDLMTDRAARLRSYELMARRSEEHTSELQSRENLVC